MRVARWRPKQRPPSFGRVDGIGLELRYEWNGDLRASQVFKTWEELEALAAEEKRRELEAKGWAAA